MKFIVGFVVVTLSFVAILGVGHSYGERKRTETYTKVGAVKVDTSRKDRSYICVKEGLIVDKETGKVVGL